MKRFYCSAFNEQFLFIGTFNFDQINLLQSYKLDYDSQELFLSNQIEIYLPITQIRAFDNLIFVSTDHVTVFDSQLNEIRTIFTDNQFPILDFSVVFNGHNYEVTALSHGQILINNPQSTYFLKIIRQNWSSFFPFGLDSQTYFLLTHSSPTETIIVILNQKGQLLKPNIKIPGTFIQLVKVEEVRIQEALALYILTSKFLFYLQIEIINKEVVSELVNMELPVIENINQISPTETGFLAISDNKLHQIVEKDELVIENEIDFPATDLNSFLIIKDKILLLGTDFMEIITL